MTATPALTTDLQREVLRLEDDLRARVGDDAGTDTAWRAEYARAFGLGRTAASWEPWRDDRVTQAAVAWVLTTVFVRFCEDNALVTPVWIAGPEARRQEALDAQLAFFREHPEDTDREWLQQAIDHLAGMPATAALVDEHSALHLVSPSGDAATALLGFWRARADDGRLVHDLSDTGLSTRFLGDLYQDLSQHAKDTYALLQTPVFVEEFILDQTMVPALAERPLEGFRLIDPTCGSGHFLLGAFDRLLDRWNREAPGLEVQARVQQALDSVHGVDVNPFAVAITRFRLTVAALSACGLRSLRDAPAFAFHLAAGDSLLHGEWQLDLDLGTAYDADTVLSGFAYGTEDLAALRVLLTPGRYDVVVGNPPYITVKDKALNVAYRDRYKTCYKTYALTVPFMERFFELAKTGHMAGWVGQIMSNSFMKREFGSKLIEAFLTRQDLRLVVDTSGAYIPGHGTPTVIIVGRHRSPVGDTVRAVLGVRGEPGRPADPAKGLVWRSIVEQVDEPGWDDSWITVADLPRKLLATHPWSLSGGGAVGLLARVNAVGGLCVGAIIGEIGRTTHTGNDEAFFVPTASVKTLALSGVVVPVVLGEDVRDFRLMSAISTLLPYDENGGPRELSTTATKLLWRSRRSLETQLDFQQTKAQRGLRWFDHSMFFAKRYRTPLSIAFAFVATHNHFVLDRGGKVFNRTAPTIKLPAGVTEDDHLALLGVLNSSTACFWLKTQCQAKPMVDEAWAMRYEYNGGNVADYPLPATLPLDRGRLLDGLAQELSRKTPAAVGLGGVPTAAALGEARVAHESLRADMIAHQEELDWEVYRLYGLIDDDLTYAWDYLPPLALGERAFEIALARKVGAGEEETAWFARHGSTPITELPRHWPAEYRELVQRRLDLIEADPAIRLLEKPEHKRRWAAVSWEKQQERALRDWLLDRLEDRRFWFDPQGRPAPQSVAQLADVVARDPDLVSVLALWEGRPDVPTTQSLTRLLSEEAVPFLAAYRYKETGLRKRAAWERTWALQRREDAGEKLDPIAVPPKYTGADFAHKAFWAARGKLDVPKERFIAYPHAGRDTDPTALLGWAGWDHAQQSLALSVIIGAREAEGWDDERLVPLVAGLAELQPWVEQWHGQVDPTYGVSLAAFCHEQLTSRASQVGWSVDNLVSWRPTATGRGRKPKQVKQTS